MAVETQREFEKREINLEVFERFDSFQITQEVTPTPDVTFDGPHLRNLTQKIKKIKVKIIIVLILLYNIAPLLISLTIFTIFMLIHFVSSCERLRKLLAELSSRLYGY